MLLGDEPEPDWADQPAKTEIAKNWADPEPLQERDGHAAAIRKTTSRR